MKHRLALFILCIALGFQTPTAGAQDGWLFSARPPIVVRDGHDGYFYLTNTSDQVLHGITIHNNDKGTETSQVIIDTIEPHKTATINFSVKFLINDPALTCTNYSKPLPLKLLP